MATADEICIIGNGVAGMEAARGVRARDPGARITLISEESDHYFSRTALMWIASGQLSHRDTEPLERDAYAHLGLRRVRARAVGIDPDAHRVKLAGGLEDVPYDRLLIACGSRPRPASWPGAELAGVGHFVTHQDLAWLVGELGHARADLQPPRPRHHLAASEPSSPYAFRPLAADQRGTPAKRPIVVGGGLIGLEAVEVCLALGVQPTFLLRAESFWPMALEPRESRWIAQRMREHGVDVRLEHEVQAVRGDDGGLVCGVVTDQGEVEGDALLVAIGVVPNTQWLEGSDIELERGAVVVDAGLATSATDVFAAGDCAGVRWFDGQRRAEQLWYTARDQGRVAAQRLCGLPAAYERGIFYNSAKLMDIEYTTCGLVNMNVAGERNWFFEERGEVRSTLRIVANDRHVVGFNALGRRWDHSVLMDFIHERRTLDEVLDRLHEASFDTEFVPPLRIPAAARHEGLSGPAPSAVREPIDFPGSW